MNLSLAPDAAIDLQLHTTFSDGRWSAEQLFDYLADADFALVAVTDHDRVDTLTEIQDQGRLHQIAVLPAVEMSTQWHGKMADLLCFGFDPHQAQDLRAIADRIRQQAAANADEVYEELLRQGYSFPHRDELLAANKGELRVSGDCARLLIQHGYMKDWSSALATIREAGYREMKADLGETVNAVHRAGGIALIAHPGRGKQEPDFTYYTPELLDQVRASIPLDGIEVYYPTHSPPMVEDYLAYVRQHDLLLSAGSDSHGPPGRLPIKYRADLCRQLLERVGIHVS